MNAKFFTKVENSYSSYEAAFTWMKKVLDTTGINLIESESPFAALINLEHISDSLVKLTHAAGYEQYVSVNWSTSVIDKVEDYLDGVLMSDWTGEISVENFVEGVWPMDGIHYGSQTMDWLDAVKDATVFGQGGNDYIELSGGIASGGEGQDVYIIGGDGHSVITDYQVGEKLVFNLVGIDSLEGLANHLTNIETAAGGGFKLSFRESSKGSDPWSLSFENVDINVLQLSDLIVEPVGVQQILAPIYEFYGIFA